MQTYVIDDMLFVKHGTGIINGYDAEHIQNERDMLQKSIDDLQEQADYWNNILNQISPPVKVSFVKRIVNRFRKM